ncbi:hypothetical protein [Streptosporangium sp. NPDC006930]|uniref:hypothetical protein n=1 Tax=unclassified Streptosporangium TaxID=2632669 RepID=UPI00342E4FCA
MLSADSVREAHLDWLIGLLETGCRWTTAKHSALMIGKKILDSPTEATKKVTP